MHPIHICVKPDYASASLHSSMRLAHNAAMPREVTFLRAWRKHRDMTLEEVAPIVGLSQPQLGRIEVGKQPYNQDLLEALAEIYSCTVIDLIKRDPQSPPPPPDNVVSIFDRIPEDRIPQALQILETFTKSA